MSIVNKANELHSRFSFAFFRADQSPKVAELMGLLTSNYNIKKDEKYLYRVCTGTLQKIFHIDTVFVDVTKTTSRNIVFIKVMKKNYNTT